MDPREHREALWFLPTFIHSLNKMSAEVLIAAVTGHPVLYDPSLCQFRDRNAKALAWAEVSWLVGLYVS